jgi:hypothetical protein
MVDYYRRRYGKRPHTLMVTIDMFHLLREQLLGKGCDEATHDYKKGMQYAGITIKVQPSAVPIGISNIEFVDNDLNGSKAKVTAMIVGAHGHAILGAIARGPFGYHYHPNPDFNYGLSVENLSEIRAKVVELNTQLVWDEIKPQLKYSVPDFMDKDEYETFIFGTWKPGDENG